MKIIFFFLEVFLNSLQKFMVVEYKKHFLLSMFHEKLKNKDIHLK